MQSFELFLDLSHLVLAECSYKVKLKILCRESNARASFQCSLEIFFKRHLYGIFCTGKIYISNVNKDIAKAVTIYWDLKLFSYELLEHALGSI